MNWPKLKELLDRTTLTTAQLATRMDCTPATIRNQARKHDYDINARNLRLNKLHLEQHWTEIKEELDDNVRPLASLAKQYGVTNQTFRRFCSRKGVDMDARGKSVMSHAAMRRGAVGVWR